MKNAVKNKQKIEVQEVGFYLKLLRQEYGQKTQEEYIKLIEEDFDLVCTKQDIEDYERLHIEMEDYEKLSRMAEYNVEHLIE